MIPAWFEDHQRQVHMDFHMPEFPPDAIRNFDAKRFVGQLVRGRVNMIALFSKCHFGNSFYNTTVGHKHAGLEADFLMETAAECRSQGIRTIAYFSFCWDKHAWDDNPAWRYVNAEGNTPGADRAWGILCMNTPYREESCLPQIDEIARDYPVDGFFLDIPYAPGPCFCPFCKRKFEALYGAPLDASTPEELLLRFRAKTCVNWLEDVRRICDRHNPELILVPNGLGHLRHSREALLAQDVGVWESQPGPGDYLRHSFAARTCRTLPRPAQVMTVRFFRGWGDMTMKPEAQLTTEFAAMIANGAPANSGDQVKVDGSLQSPVYDLFDKSFGFVEAREEILKGARSVRHAALLLPEPDAGLPMGLYFDDRWRAAHKALVESHVQFDNLMTGDIDALDTYDLVILPGPCRYTPEVFDRLRAWVEQGGTLVAVGPAVFGDGKLWLEDVFGVSGVEPLPFSTCHFSPREELGADTAAIPLQLRAGAWKVVPGSAEVLADLHRPIAENQPPVKAFRSPYPPARDEPSPWPFITVNAFGKGRGVLMTGDLFKAYWETSHHWLRQTVEALCRYLAPEPPFRVDASPIVEANLMAKGDDLLLNVLQYQLGHQGEAAAIPAVERVHPISDIACAVRAGKRSRVVLEPEGEELPVERDGEYLRFTLPSLHYMAIARVTA